MLLFCSDYVLTTLSSWRDSNNSENARVFFRLKSSLDLFAPGIAWGTSDTFFWPGLTGKWVVDTIGFFLWSLNLLPFMGLRVWFIRCAWDCELLGCFTTGFAFSLLRYPSNLFVKLGIYLSFTIRRVPELISGQNVNIDRWCLLFSSLLLSIELQVVRRSYFAYCFFSSAILTLQ